MAAGYLSDHYAMPEAELPDDPLPVRLAESYAAGDAARAWEALSELARDRPDELRERLLAPIQTNEVARCGPLAAGFLFVARETELPLRLLEVGASAGLNLRFDLYRYA